MKPETEERGGLGEQGEKPLVVSLTGTYLKAEMQSIYRQLSNLSGFRTTVLAENLENLDKFPLDDVQQLVKRERPRFRGNFLKRFWFKHVIRQWPPPEPIGHAGRPLEYYHPYDLVDRLEELSPALVHVYYGHKATKYHRMLQAWGGPWIVSFHGVDVVKFFDQDGYHDQMRAVFRDAALVLARSESLLGRLEELGCPREKLRLNRTPVPLAHITPHKPAPPGDGEPWRIVQACRLIPKKGIFTALEAIAGLTPDFPNLRYSIFGDGPQRDEIEARAAQLGISDHLELHGWVEQEELAAEYQNAHLFLHPSELTEGSDQEGVPNSMLEAMAHGLPVVATHHGGIPEAVTDGHDGLLSPEKDAPALAANLRRLLTDPALLTHLSQNAAASVREHYALPNSIAAMEACYAEAQELAPAPDTDAA